MHVVANTLAGALILVLFILIVLLAGYGFYRFSKYLVQEFDLEVDYKRTGSYPAFPNRCRYSKIIHPESRDIMYSKEIAFRIAQILFVIFLSSPILFMCYKLGENLMEIL